MWTSRICLALGFLSLFGCRPKVEAKGTVPASPPPAAQTSAVVTSSRIPEILVRQPKAIVVANLKGEPVRKLLDGYSRQAMWDPTLGLLWALQGDKIVVVDLRSQPPKSITIVEQVREDATFKVHFQIGEKEKFLTQLTLCEGSNFGIVSIEWLNEPTLSFFGETEDHDKWLAAAKLIGKEWLTANAKRTWAAEVESLDFYSSDAEGRRVRLPKGMGHCDDSSDCEAIQREVERYYGKRAHHCENPSDCGSTMKLANTELLLVMTKSIDGEDCRDVGCLLYDPRTRRFASPYQPNEWKRSIKMANDCGLFRFESTGKRYYLLGDSLCEVGVSCTSLGGEALGWMEPWIEVGLPTADTSVPQEPAPPLRDRLK